MSVCVFQKKKKKNIWFGHAPHVLGTVSGELLAEEEISYAYWMLPYLTFYVPLQLQRDYLIQSLGLGAVGTLSEDLYIWFIRQKERERERETRIHLGIEVLECYICTN